MMFDFEEGFALFDMTPVDNQFIQEYLPSASGDAVRVYLYGLMRCYHPDRDMTPEQMARELNMTEADVMTAFRFWERRGLVLRVGDHPVMFRFVSVRKKNMDGGGVSIDPAYEAFTDSLYNVFDHERRLHGAEIRQCYEWVEDLKLPQEAVIMLLKHMEKKKGKSFSIKSADQTARQMADEGITTVEAAEEFLSRDHEEYEGAKNVVKRLGQHNPPSEAQIALYRKWVKEWHFTREAIETVCDLAGKGKPTMGYMEGILQSLLERAEPDGQIDNAVLSRLQEEEKKLKKVTKAVGISRMDNETYQWYRKLLADYPEDLILVAAGECRGKSLEEVGELLASWKKKDILTAGDARRYVKEFRAQSSLLRQLREMWGLRYILGTQDRERIAVWEKELGFTPEQILYAGRAAADAEKPMLYLNKLLQEYAAKGIRTPEQMDQERQEHQAQQKQPGGTAVRPAKQVIAQQYSQRDYTDAQETEEEMVARLSGGKISEG